MASVRAAPLVVIVWLKDLRTSNPDAHSAFPQVLRSAFDRPGFPDSVEIRERGFLKHHAEHTLEQKGALVLCFCAVDDSEEVITNRHSSWHQHPVFVFVSPRIGVGRSGQTANVWRIPINFTAEQIKQSVRQCFELRERQAKLQVLLDRTRSTLRDEQITTVDSLFVKLANAPVALEVTDHHAFSIDTSRIQLSTDWKQWVEDLKIDPFVHVPVWTHENASRVQMADNQVILVYHTENPVAPTVANKLLIEVFQRQSDAIERHAKENLRWNHRVTSVESFKTEFVPLIRQYMTHYRSGKPHVPDQYYTPAAKAQSSEVWAKNAAQVAEELSRSIAP
jgi:hypothetical protein